MKFRRKKKKPVVSTQPTGKGRFDCPRCGSLTRCKGCVNGTESYSGVRK